MKVGVTIGANVTILCSVTIGRYAMIDVGLVFTQDVAPFTLVVGNPAGKISWVGHIDARLDDDLVCPRT